MDKMKDNFIIFLKSITIKTGSCFHLKRQFYHSAFSQETHLILSIKTNLTQINNYHRISPAATVSIKKDSDPMIDQSIPSQ